MSQNATSRRAKTVAHITLKASDAQIRGSPKSSNFDKFYPWNNWPICTLWQRILTQCYCKFVHVAISFNVFTSCLAEFFDFILHLVVYLHRLYHTSRDMPLFNSPATPPLPPPLPLFLSRPNPPQRILCPECPNILLSGSYSWVVQTTNLVAVTSHQRDHCDVILTWRSLRAFSAPSISVHIIHHNIFFCSSFCLCMATSCLSAPQRWTFPP